MQDESAIEKWKASAEAWIIDQGEKGDRSRRAILDPALEQQLPDVAGKQVLDLGCGEGRYSRASTTDSWVKDTEGNKLYRKVDRYMEHFALDLEWRNIRVKNFHRPLSYVLSLFFERGFLMERFEEPLPAKQDRNYQEEFRVPNFQIYTFRYLPDLE